MTILPVTVSDFREELQKHIDTLQPGTVEIHVTRHKKTVMRCLPPLAPPEVENPPGVDAELMNRLWSGEEEPTPLAVVVVSTPGDPRYHSGVSGAAGSTAGQGGVGGALTAKTPTAGPKAPAAAPPRKRTPKPPSPPKEPKPPGPADLARLIGWPKSAFPVNFQKPRPGKGDDWTLWGKLGHKRVWPGLGKLGRAEALGWCIKAVEGGE